MAPVALISSHMGRLILPPRTGALFFKKNSQPNWPAAQTRAVRRPPGPSSGVSLAQEFRDELASRGVAPPPQSIVAQEVPEPPIPPSNEPEGNKAALRAMLNKWRDGLTNATAKELREASHISPEYIKQGVANNDPVVMKIFRDMGATDE